MSRHDQDRLRRQARVLGLAVLISCVLFGLGLWFLIGPAQWTVEAGEDTLWAALGTVGVVCVAFAAMVTAAAYADVRKKLDALGPRFREVYTRAENDLVLVCSHGGDLSDEVVHGEFLADEDDALSQCLADARHEADAHRDRVLDAHAKAATLNRTLNR